MWIRSRDKKLLVSPQAVYVDVLDNGQVTLVCNDDENSLFVLGNYASEEEAISELDCVARWINRGARGVYEVN